MHVVIKPVISGTQKCLFSERKVCIWVSFYSGFTYFGAGADSG